MAIKYFEHFLYIAHAMTNIDGAGIDLWDTEDEFFYDVILLPSGQSIPLRDPLDGRAGAAVRRVRRLADQDCGGSKTFVERARWFVQHRPDLLKNVAPVFEPGEDDRKLMSILTKDRLDRRAAADARSRRSSSPTTASAPCRATTSTIRTNSIAADSEFTVKYLPAESDSRLFGGNSNWRGPIWFPVNYMIVRSLHEFSLYYGDNVQSRMPHRLRPNAHARRGGRANSRGGSRASSSAMRPTADGGPCWGDNEYFQTDPHWRDCVPFSEYFNGDTGAGVGASHQTGWTALVVSLLYEYWEQHGQS